MKNYNVLIGGYDFEQKIHRGITFYGKSLIRALNGYNLSLLTGVSGYKEERLTLLKILKHLDNPQMISNKLKIKKYIKYLLNLNRSDLIKNNYKLFGNKLQYLKFINKFYNLENVYDVTAIHNRVRLKSPMKLDVQNINKVILTSPTNVVFNVPMIQTLHDVIPLTCIYHPPFDDSKIFYYRVKNMLEYSEKVISVSNFAKEECLKIFPKYEDKIIVTYQPVPIYEEDKELAEDEVVKKAVLNKFKLISDNFLFYVGMLEQRKNIKNMIEAFLAIYEKIKIPLVLAGGLGYGREEFESYLKDESLNNKIIYLGYISNIEKLVLLKNARAFIFPSFSEGFGLPPLEAMACGCPVVTSNITSLPEVCADAAIYCDPYSVISIQNAREKVMNMTESERKLLIKKGYERVKFFNVNDYKNKVLKVYESIL